MDKNTILAIKEYNIRHASYLRGIIAYAKNVIQLNHPNICKFYGMAVERSNIYLLMEYCEGSLELLLASGRIEDSFVVKKYLKEILEGLNYLHSQGMIHRDIKPSNILLGQENKVKISGFTCMRMETHNADLDQDKSFALVGTARYISPEIVRGEFSPIPSAQDIWAVCILSCQMVTGKIPYYQYDHDWAVYYHIGKGELPEFPTSKEMSEEGLEFVQNVLTAPPNRRPKASELLQHAWLRSI